MSPYRDMPREALEAEIDKLRAEVERLSGPTWWARFKAWLLRPAPARRVNEGGGFDVSVPALTSGRSEGEVWFAGKAAFVVIDGRVFGSERPDLRYEILASLDWVDVATGKSAPKPVGEKAGAMALASLRAKRDARKAAEWRKKAGLA